ncbi:MAG: chromate transporter [Candidatus Korobacteraceae bacterium]|jgi:chromate transporter
MQNGTNPASTPSGVAGTVTLKHLFAGFLKIGLLGFGGVAPIARHVIVEDRAWLTEQEYASVMGIGQVLPGANTINAAVMIGDRFRGIAGAIVCLVSMMVMPLVIVTCLGVLYHRFAALPQVQAAISGSAAAAAGLVIGAALKMARRLHPTAIALVFGLLAFIAVGLLNLSLIAVVAVLVPLSVGAAYLGYRREG